MDTKKGDRLLVEQGKYIYEVIAGVALIPSSEVDEPHAGEWEAVVTISRICSDEPDRAQTFPETPQYGATEQEAIRKGLEYGRKLVLGGIKGLTI